MTRASSLLLLFSTAASAGTTLTWERVRGNEPPATLTMKCEGGSARFDTSIAPRSGSARPQGEADAPKGAQVTGDRAVIWDAGAKTLSILHHSDKTYRQLTEAQLDAMRERMKAGMEKMKSRLDQLPPEQRAQAEKMIAAGTGLAGEWKFTPTGKKAKIGKWECDWYDAERGAFKTQTCLMPWASAPAKKEDLECVKSAVSMFQSIARAADDTPAEDFTRFPGIPIQTVRDNGDGTKNTNTLKAVERGPLGADPFAVPKGYTLTDKRE